MTQNKVELFKKRFENAKSRKTNWGDLYQDAMNYAAPQRETFDYEFPGQHKDGSDVNVYDSTAQDALFKFASNLQSSMTPPMKRWVNLVPGSQLQDNEDLKEKLSNITDILFSNLAQSNFDTQIAESYLDLGFGTGALLIFKGDRRNPFRFVNVPLSQIYLEEGAHGRITTAFRKYKIQGRAVPKQFPDAKFSKQFEKMLNENPDDMYTFVEGTFPEKLEMFNAKKNQEEEIDGYSYVVLAQKADEIIVERKMRSSPWLIFRWANLPGEIYGRGPVLNALPDIKSLNKTKELLLKSASINTFGMYTVADDGIINIENIQLGAGAMIPVGDNPGSPRGPTIAPLQPSGRPDLTQIVIEDLKASINKMMFGSPLGDVNLPVKTATEVSLRQQELAKRIGAAFGKLQFELINPLIDRLLSILDELGLIDLADFKLSDGVIDINHMSPLATAQDEEDVVKNVRLVETIVGLFGAEVALGLLNVDDFARMLENKMKTEPSLVKSKEEMDEIKKKLAQAAQAQQQMPPQQ